MTGPADWSALNADAVTVARRLLGCELLSDIDGRTTGGIIVETEAYDQTDAASHSYRGRTPRTDVMFGPAGHLYVYFTYGMHYCCNVTAGPEGHGAAVLIRALAPTVGADVMEERRGRGGLELTNGPAKLCRALGIDRRQNGVNLRTGPVRLRWHQAAATDRVVQSARIGISRETEKPWRFYIQGDPYVSKT